MLLPMFGFVLVLMVAGGLASLVAAADPRHARWTPFIGFVALFAGLGAFLLSLGLAWVLGAIFHSETAAGVGFLGGDVVGGLGGAAFGLNRAFLRRRRFEMADE